MTGHDGTVLVLSVAGPALEDRIAALGGPRIHVAMPAASAVARAATEPPYAVYPLPEWNDLNQALHLARAVHATSPLGTVVGALEPAVVAAAFIRTMLDLPGLDYETALRSTDKHRMKLCLGAADLPVAAHRLAHSADDMAAVAAAVGGFPVIMKPRTGFGVINTHVVRSAAEADTLRRTGILDRGVNDRLAGMLTPTGVGTGLATQTGGFLVERFLDVVAEYHCEVLRVAGTTVYALPGRYLTPLLSDDAILGSVVLDPESVTGALVRQMSTAAVQALGIDDGFAHVEILRDRSGRWYIGEVAARRGGAALPQMMRLAYGIDSLDLEAQWARGRTPAPIVTTGPGVYGWSGVRIRHHGRVAEIAGRDEIRAQPGVIDATVLIAPGQQVAPGGSGMFAGHVFYQADTEDEVIAAMRTTGQRLRLRYQPSDTHPTNTNAPHDAALAEAGTRPSVKET